DLQACARVPVTLPVYDRSAEGLEPGLAQRGAGLDHVGDDVGAPETDRGLHGAVEVDHLGGDAALEEIVLDEVLVAGGDAGALELGEVAAGLGRWRGAEGGSR